MGLAAIATGAGFRVHWDINVLNKCAEGGGGGPPGLGLAGLDVRVDGTWEKDVLCFKGWGGTAAIVGGFALISLEVFERISISL